MGLFETLFKRPKTVDSAGYFQMLNGYSPIFTSAPGSVYEMAVTRAAIHSFATFCSKLKPEITGSAAAYLKNTLAFRPNPFQDTSKFLYRIATILSVNNTAFIVPIEDKFTGNITGFYPLLPEFAEFVEVGGEVYVRYRFANGQRAAIELDHVGILTGYQYKSDLIGESNTALKPTMELIHAQNEGIIKGVKNGASIRFLARLGNMYGPDVIAAERKRFTAENLSSDNESGVLIYDNKFADLKQVESKPFTVNALQMKAINENVYQYFGTNEAILQNRYTEDEWTAYYEAKIEPFAIQLSLIMSNMIFSDRELAHGNAIYFTANRLQYASNRTKLDVSTQLFDRGILSRNEIMDIWQLPHVEGGDKRYIRKEYAEVELLHESISEEEGEDGSR